MNSIATFLLLFFTLVSITGCGPAIKKVPLGKPPVATTSEPNPMLILMIKSLMEQSRPKEDYKCLETENCVPVWELNGSIESSTASILKDFLDGWTKAGARAIIIVIDSPGGSVDESNRMAGMIKNSPIPVHCFVQGRAMSGAFWMLQACSTRTVERSSSLMTHQAYYASIDNVHMHDFPSLQESMRVTNVIMSEFISRRMGMTVEEYNKKVENGKDWHFGWADSLKNRAADYVSDSLALYKKYVKLHLEAPVQK